MPGDGCAVLADGQADLIGDEAHRDHGEAAAQVGRLDRGGGDGADLGALRLAGLLARGDRALEGVIGIVRQQRRGVARDCPAANASTIMRNAVSAPSRKRAGSKLALDLPHPRERLADAATPGRAARAWTPARERRR